MLMPAPAMFALFVKVDNFVNRTAVNAYAHPQLGMILEFLANFHRTQNWRFCGIPKNECAAIARRQA